MRSGVELNTSSSPTPAQLSSLSLGPEPLSYPTFRPSPKSAGSASLPSAPLNRSRSATWESDDKRGRSGTKKSLGLTKLEVDEGPFSDPLRSPSISARERKLSLLSTANDPLSLPPTPDCNYARRNSTLSTSSMSHSPSSPMGIYVPSTSRQRYSIASSSYANTIGDLSTSSMPLLRQSKGGDETSSSNGIDLSGLGAGHGGSGSGGGGWTNRASSYAASSSSRVHMAESSRASIYSDDASSVHSYPPKPRQRTGSTWTTSENGDGSRGSWARDFESLGATGQVQRRGSADSRTDPWPPFVSNSYLHQPIARPTPAYLSQLSNYSFPPVPAKTSPPRSSNPPPAVRSGGLGSSNPLAPLRKRLARSLAGSGGQLHTEVQLLLELVDALDHCITLFSTQTPTDPSSLSPMSRSSHPPLFSSLPAPFDESATPSIGPTRNSKSALLDEVRLLVRELVELVPDAQRCLTNGQYGPLAFPNTTTIRLMQSLENKEIVESPSPSPPILKTPRPTSWKSGTHSSEWWPSRLAKDCRSLLVEAGLPTGRGSTVWQLAARLSEEGLEETLSPSLSIDPTITTSSGGVGGGGGGGTTDTEGQEEESPTLLPSARSESARRDELLEQGKKRWEDYRQKQQQKGQKAGGGGGGKLVNLSDSFNVNR